MRRKAVENQSNGDGFGDTLFAYAGGVISSRTAEVRYQNELWGDGCETAFTLQLAYEDVGA